VVADICAIVSGFSEYKKDGTVTIELFVPTSLVETAEFVALGSMSIRD